MPMTAVQSAVTGPGFYVRGRAGGFAVHILACQEHVQRLRGLVDSTLCEAGADGELSDSAQLVVTELVSNAVRACGDFVPLVVETFTDGEAAVWVTVHDPDRGRLPLRPDVPADDGEAETGRGLFLIDMMAPGWDVTLTPIGKQVRCRLPPPRHGT